METVLYQITETSEFMMSFVIITKNNNAIIVDGGRKEDMPLLKEYIGGRHISAWFLTHPHDDHIDGFLYEVERNNLADFDVEKIYHHMPPSDFILQNEPDNGSETIVMFERLLPQFEDKTCIVNRGDKFSIDEVNVEVLYHFDGTCKLNAINDSSIVFRISTENSSVMFLGDLGPEGGVKLLRENYGNLKADYVQMAHHGHMCCEFEVYYEISPKACFWCCPDWLYEEPPLSEWMAKYSKPHMCGTMMTRMWMDLLGVKTHYVTKDGTQKVIL